MIKDHAANYNSITEIFHKVVSPKKRVTREVPTLNFHLSGFRVTRI